MVSGPAGATQCTLRELGWGFSDPWHLLTASGETIATLDIAPKQVLAKAEQTLQMQMLQKWTEAKEDRTHLKPRPWMAPPRLVLRQKPTAKWSFHHRAAARVASSSMTVGSSRSPRTRRADGLSA